MNAIENGIVTYRDDDTGFIMADGVNLHKYDLVDKEEAARIKEAINKKKEIERYKDRTDNPFTMVNMEGARDLLAMERLNTKELGYFLVLQTYIGYNNMLKMSLDAVVPMTEKELAEVLKIKQKRTYSGLLVKLMELGLIYKEKVTKFNKEYEAFFLNKDYCLRGPSKENKVVKVFIKQLQELYGQEDIKPADIGFLFRILPYMHHKSNHLVRHPYEMDYANAEALSLKDIVEITGQDKKNVSEHLKMKLSGVRVFGSFKSENIVYKVNPWLLFRGIEPDETLKADFTLTGQSL